MSTQGRGIDWPSLDPATAQYLRSQGFAPGEPSQGAAVVIEKVKQRGREPSKLQRMFVETCERAKADGAIRAAYPEAIKLRLAGNTTYSPDVFVVDHEFRGTMVEVKGEWEDGDCRVKIKVAAALYPCWRWLYVQRAGNWEVHEVTAQHGISRKLIVVPWINGV